MAATGAASGTKAASSPTARFYPRRLLPRPNRAVAALVALLGSREALQREPHYQSDMLSGAMVAPILKFKPALPGCGLLLGHIAHGSRAADEHDLVFASAGADRSDHFSEMVIPHQSRCERRLDQHSIDAVSTKERQNLTKRARKGRNISLCERIADSDLPYDQIGLDLAHKIHDGRRSVRRDLPRQTATLDRYVYAGQHLLKLMLKPSGEWGQTRSW